MVIKSLLYFLLSVDSCVPGDVVTVSGMVKVTSSDEGMPEIIFTMSEIQICFYTATYQKANLFVS